jgi:hypothetical protein
VDDVLAPFCACYPRLEIDLTMLPVDDLLDEVAQSRAHIGRAVMVARDNHLDRLLAKSPAAAMKLAELRRLSGLWPKALQDAAQNVALAAHGTAVDSGRLLNANESLNAIMDSWRCCAATHAT